MASRTDVHPPIDLWRRPTLDLWRSLTFGDARRRGLFFEADSVGRNKSRAGAVESVLLPRRALG